MALVLTAVVNRRGCKDAGEKMGDPIRRRAVRTSPSARLIAVRVEFDREEMRREHRGLADALIKSPSLATQYLEAEVKRSGLLRRGDSIQFVDSTVTLT